MRKLHTLTYVFSPLIVSLLVGTLLARLNRVGGLLFVVIILIGLLVSMINCVIVIIQMSGRK